MFINSSGKLKVVDADYWCQELECSQSVKSIENKLTQIQCVNVKTKWNQELKRTRDRERKREYIN